MAVGQFARRTSDTAFGGGDFPLRRLSNYIDKKRVPARMLRDLNALSRRAEASARRLSDCGGSRDFGKSD